MTDIRSRWCARRAAAVLAGLALGAAACGGTASDHGADSECTFDSKAAADAGIGDCVVWYDRGGETRSAILNVDLVLVTATAEYVTLRVGAEELVLAVGGSEVGRLAGLDIRLGGVDAERVSVFVTRTR